MEGQTVTISVSADPSVQGILVLTEHPLPNVQATSIPTQFTLTLPTNVIPGVYQITAIGFAPSGYVQSAPVQVDVERQDVPVSISVKPTFQTIGVIGSNHPINVQGTFADGTTLSLTHSSLTNYISDDTSVVTVASNGLMTAVGPGFTTVIVQYGVLGQPSWTVTTFQVTVPPPPPSGPAPVINSVSPTSGTPGMTQVTVSGSNFGSTQGSGSVELGNTDATMVSSWSDSQIVATVPLGSGPGVAQVYQNGLYSNTIPFTTVVPSISSVSPASGTAGTQITITGSNFGASQGSSTILINGAWTNAVNWSNSTIVATVSAYASTGNVVVNVNGVPSNAVPFTTSPSITGLAPAFGLPGTSVTITGSNFGPTQGTSTVTFNGIPATPGAWNWTSISVPVPTGATSGPVVVTVNGMTSNPSTFSVGQSPAITSANSTTFTVGTASSFTVTTTGTPTPTLSETGAFPSGVSFIDNGNGTATLSGTPAAGGGVYNITITAANGISPNASQSFALIVDQAPAITSANATTFAVGTLGSFTVTATGYPVPTITESGTLPGGVTYSGGVLSGTPASGSNQTYNITFTASNGVGTNAVQSFTLVIATLQIVPTSVSFGTMYFLQPAVRFVTLTNSGGMAITISGINITTPGNALGDYGEITNCTPLIPNMPGTLPAGKSCTIVVGILPTVKIFGPTASTATITITDTAAQSPQLVPLTAQVINPQATLSSSSLTFPPQKVGTTSTTQSVTLTNTGNTPLNLGTVAISGDFALASGTTCSNGGTVAAGGNCVINVTFAPTAKGTRTGRVTITDNALISPQVIFLVGTGS
jgi:hypothetical protein